MLGRQLSGDRGRDAHGLVDRRAVDRNPTSRNHAPTERDEPDLYGVEFGVDRYDEAIVAGYDAWARSTNSLAGSVIELIDPSRLDEGGDEIADGRAVEPERAGEVGARDSTAVVHEPQHRREVALAHSTGIRRRS